MRKQTGQSADSPIYTKEQVARWVGPVTIDKARGYVRAVSGIVWTDNTLRARVAGTQPDATGAVHGRDLVQEQAAVRLLLVSGRL